MFTADISMTLTKAKNKAPSTVKTAIDSIATTPVAGKNISKQLTTFLWEYNATTHVIDTSIY